MANAPLNAARTRTVFKILRGFFSGGSAQVTNGYGIVLTVSDLDTLKNAITAEIDKYAADEETCTEIAALCDKWEVLSGAAYEGALQVGSINLANASINLIRAQILSELQVFINIFHIKESVAKRENQSAGGGAGFSVGRIVILAALLFLAGCGESGRCTAQRSQSVSNAPHLCEGGMCK